VDVNTGERINIQGHTKIAFTPDPALRDAVNKPFQHFETVVLQDNIDFDDAGEEDEEAAVEEPAPTPTPPPVPPLPPVEQKERDSYVAPAISSNAAPFIPRKHRRRRHFISANKLLNILLILLVVAFVGFMYYLNNAGQHMPTLQHYNTSDPAHGEDSVDLSRDEEATSDSLKMLAEEDLMAKNVEGNIDSGDIYVPKQNDSTQAQPQTTPKPVDTVVAPKPAEKTATKPVATRKVYPKNTTYKITGLKATHKLKKGEWLAQLAQKYYGNRLLYTYIVQYNKNIISNPNSVPPGSVLKIPELEPVK
jgi:hypothetical protein